MIATSVIATVTSAVSWAAVFDGVAIRGLSAWAAMTGVIAALCWAGCIRGRRVDDRLQRVAEEYRRREAALIRTAALLADEQPTTGPLPRLYPVA